MWAWETARLPAMVEYTSPGPASTDPRVLVQEGPPEDELNAGGGCWNEARDVAAAAPDWSVGRFATTFGWIGHGVQLAAMQQ